MKDLFNKPSLIGLIADINTGKSNLLYHIIETLREDSDFNLFTYGLKFPQGHQVFSLEEMEQIKDSIILIDETFNLFDLDNRSKKRQIENTLRLIHHNNNVIILSMLPENGKKFLSAKINTFIFKKCAISDCINGSRIKKIIGSYCGPEKGHAVLDIPIDQALTFDGKSFNMLDVKYYKEFDSKKGNKPILIDKNAHKIRRVL